MSRIRFSDKQIADIVMELTGEVEPYGDSYIDSERSDNLLRLQNVVDILLEEIMNCADYRERPEWSMKNIADTADNWLEEKKVWLEELYKEQEHE